MATRPDIAYAVGQAVVALSTSEVEYVALSHAAQEAVRLQHLLNEIGDVQETVVVMEDNQRAIAMAKNLVSHSRTKHINIRYHYIRETVESGLINTCYCPSAEMKADIFTKSLTKEHFQVLRRSLSLEHPIT